jgi:hypothetical protein
VKITYSSDSSSITSVQDGITHARRLYFDIEFENKWDFILQNDCNIANLANNPGTLSPLRTKVEANENEMSQTTGSNNDYAAFRSLNSSRQVSLPYESSLRRLLMFRSPVGLCHVCSPRCEDQISGQSRDEPRRGRDMERRC